jgi:2,5-furandicarboxylate decarboxylase 1
MRGGISAEAEHFVHLFRHLGNGVPVGTGDKLGSTVANDLRGFLDALRAQRSNDIVVISKEVDPDEEAIALVRNLEARGQHPVVWFERVRGATGPVVVNVHASAERLAFALGTTRASLNQTYAERMRELLPPVMASGGPVLECEIPERDIDLTQLPILTPFADCRAPYLSGGIMVVKDGETGVRNLSYIRLMVTGPKTMTMHAAPFQHTDIVIRNAAKRGKNCPAAIVIGYHPAIGLGALAKVPFDVDEYDCCGALLREPVALVKGRVVDIEVPALAEMVLEVEIVPTEHCLEGPYGEFTGYALPADEQPKVYVRSISHRLNPIYQDVVAGGREHL